MTQQLGVIPRQVQLQSQSEEILVRPQISSNAIETGSPSNGQTPSQHSPDERNQGDQDSQDETSRTTTHASPTENNNLALTSIRRGNFNSIQIGMDLNDLNGITDGYQALLAQNEVVIRRTDGKNKHWTVISQQKLPLYTASYCMSGLLNEIFDTQIILLFST